MSKLISGKEALIVNDVAPPEKLNKSRLKKGKQPLFSYKVLTIDTKLTRINKSTASGSHSSTRVHLRRGHIRRLSNKNVWVNACVVGDKSKGMIQKEYRVI